MDPLTEYSGLFFLSCLALATATLWFRDRVHAGNDPTPRRRNTHRALAFVACSSPPWVVMAIGGLVGPMREPGDFLNFDSGPFAYMFAASVCFVWTALLYWLFARGGAEELAESGHMRVIGSRLSSPVYVKVVFVASVLGGICTVVWMIAEALR